MSLDSAPLRQRVRVTHVRSGGQLGRRLMELGLIEGAELQVVRRAPLGDPLQIRVGDCELSVRCSEAGLVEVCPA
jgi:ferrous iron transport protein A